MQKIIPSLVWYRPFETFAYAFIRFCTGAFLLTHGVDRLFYSGSIAELGTLRDYLPTSVVGAFEIVGGLMIALGLLTRPIALLFALEWLAIAMAVPVKPGTSWLMLSASLHYPAMVAAMCFAFVLRGGGHYSLDRLLGKEF
jgi:putative oxidoreductase